MQNLKSFKKTYLNDKLYRYKKRNKHWDVLIYIEEEERSFSLTTEGKFKLTNSYPGSPKLGLEVFKNGEYYDSCETNFLFHKPRYIVEDEPNFWKEIFDLDMPVGTKFNVKESSVNVIYTIGDSENSDEASIYWITRNGEPKTTKYYIKDINEYFKKGLWVEIAKKPIYTTEDGVEIFIGDKVKYVFYVLPNFNVKYYNPSFDDRDLSNNHYF